MTKLKYSIITHKARSRVKSVHMRLGEKRRSAHTRLIGILGILIVFLVVLTITGLWQGAVRVSHITITTNDASLVTVVKQTLSGTHFFIIPNNSIFFLSENSIRQAVLRAQPDIAAVSISRINFNSISVTPDVRTPLAQWCGTSATSTPRDSIVLDTKQSKSGCYFFDGTGFVYAQTLPKYATSTSASTTVSSNIGVNTNSPLVPYYVYAPLTNPTQHASSSPLLNTVLQINKLPALFDFARKVSSFGSPVVSVVLRGDEADLFLKDNTRVTYVLGNEQAAFALLAATKKRIHINNGSLLYVDLRFPGKVYFTQQAEAKK